MIIQFDCSPDSRQKTQSNYELGWPLQIRTREGGGRQQSGSTYGEITQSLLYCGMGSCYVRAADAAHAC
jgi:hypothetical protein